MTWFKFLSHGALAPFSGYRWPAPTDDRPGEWLTWDGPRDPCRSGLHVCRPGDLPRWFNAELFAVEVEGDVDEYDSFAVASRARLVRRLATWDLAAAHRFADDCAWHTRLLAIDVLRAADDDRHADHLLTARTVEELTWVAEGVSTHGAPVAALVGYAADAARFAARVAATDNWPAATATTAFIAATAATVAAGADGHAAESAERARQARWLEQQVVHA